MDTVIKFCKVNPVAVLPSKRDEDAGFDLYAVNTENIFIKPHETALIPVGLKSVIDPGYCVIVKERGSTGSKGMAVRMGVIDSGYRGEWQVGITNTTEKTLAISAERTKQDHHDFLDSLYTIYPNTKAIAQFIVVPVPVTEILCVTDKEYNTYQSERGEGMLGSSGK